MQQKNRQIILAALPEGLPKLSDFQMVESPVPTPKAGEILIRNIYLSADAAQRFSLGNNVVVPVASSPAGRVFGGATVGQVVLSHHPGFPVGSYVVGARGWQEYAASDGSWLRILDPQSAPVTAALHVLSGSGLTAYFGLLDVGRPKPEETVVVSSAAGAVGSVVGQIAKIRGCRVVGIAGSDEKVAWVTQGLGFDMGINYKTCNDLDAALGNLCPQGVDLYFDNVGGDTTLAVFRHLKKNGRLVVCGQTALYNAVTAGQDLGPRFLWELIMRRIRVEGFHIADYADRYEEGRQQMTQWIREGRLKYQDTIVRGIDQAPATWIGLLQGRFIGKPLVQVSELE